MSINHGEFFAGKKYLFSAILALAMLGGIPRFTGLSQGLPDAIHPDEKPIIHRALYFSSGDLNPHFFLYPSLSMYATSVNLGAYVAWLRGTGSIHSIHEAKKLFVEHPERFYTAARVGNAIWGVLIVLVLFFAGRHFIGDIPAFAAAVLAALNPPLIQEAHIVKPECLLTLLGLVSFFAALRALEIKSSRWLAASAFLGGLAVSTKYNGVPFLIPAFTVGWSQAVNSERLLRRLALTGLLLGALAAAGFFLGTPYALLDYHTFLRQFADQIGFTAGLRDVPHPSRWHNVWSIPTQLAGSYTASLSLLILFFISLRNQNQFQRLAVLTVAVVYAMVLPMGIATSYYADPVLPLFFFAIGTAVFKENNYVLRMIVGLLLACGIACSAVNSLHLASKYRMPETRELARQWVETHVENEAKVLVDAGAPDLPLTYKALKEVQAKAAAAHHVKTVLFDLRLAHFNGGEKHFDVYLSSQALICSPVNYLVFSQSIQRLTNIAGGINPLILEGFKYVVVSETEEAVYRPERQEGKAFPEYRAFYESLGIDPRSRKVFDTADLQCAGPRIRIYKIHG